MKIAICDDEQVQLDLLYEYCNEWSVETREPCFIDIFKSAEEFLFKYEDIKDYTVLLLDIQMKDVSGMDLAKKLREIGEYMSIVFITGDKSYVFQGYEVQALDYIMKPITKEKLFKVLNKVKEISKKEEDFIFIQCEGIVHKIRQLDICSLESIGHDSIIHMGHKEILCKRGISALEKELRGGYFYRCHRSYLVNISKIDSISKKEVILEGNISIPIARGKWEGLNKAYLDYYRGVICG